MQKNFGFTVIEIIIVIAIIGILATVAIPNFLGWTPRYQFKSAVMELTASLQYERMRAIKEGRNCTVTFDQAAGIYELGCLNKTLELAEHSKTATFSTVSPTVFNFTARGMTDENGACTITLTDSRVPESYQIRIMPTGAMDSRQL